MIINIEKIVSGGQTLGVAQDGLKLFIWGGLPGEEVEVRITKKKSKYAEAIVEHVISPSPERITPKDPDSYLSTSPWQIMNFEAEQRYKAQLIDEAFLLHKVSLPKQTEVFTDGVEYGYRNKIEFSWYSDLDAASGVDTLDLAFFRRGSRGKIIVDGTSLARPEINKLAKEVRNLLRSKQISARQLKTLLIRSDQRGSIVWQLYLREVLPDLITNDEANKLSAQGGEIIFSNPKSPASIITKRLAKFGNTTLMDKILDVNFRYATEGFFQINIPVYEQALKDMQEWIPSENNQVIDLYSGVGTIGLTISGDNVTLVEINQHAVREMERNIKQLGKNARAILAPSEQALDHISSDKLIIVDPPRAGLHPDVVKKLLDAQPQRIIYLSCNPVTQARDVALLSEKYNIVHHRGYNFFPRTPHIENLVVIDKIKNT